MPSFESLVQKKNVLTEQPDVPQENSSAPAPVKRSFEALAQQKKIAPIAPAEEKSTLGKISSGVNTVVEGVEKGIRATQIPKVVGAAVGAAGGAVGAVVGGAAQVAKNLYQGKKTFQDVGKAAVQTAKDTASFGYDVGEGGATAAPFAGLGKIPSAVIAAPTLYEGVKEKDPTKIAIGGLALAGAGFSKGKILDPELTGGISKIKSKVTGKPPQTPVARAVDQLEDKYYEISTGVKFKKKIDKAKVKTEFKNRAGTSGTDPIRTLSEDGIIPNQKGQFIDTAEQAEQYRARLDPFNKINKEVLREVDSQVPKLDLNTWEQKAIALARTPENIASGKAEGLERELMKEFEAMRQPKNYGNEVSYETLGDIKVARAKRAPFDSTRPLMSDANYLISRSAREIIEDTAKKLGNDEVAQLNRFIGDRLEAAKFLDELNGKTVKGGRLQRYVFSIIGSTLGNTPIGKVLGAFGGDVVANMLISTTVSRGLKTKILKQIAESDPQAYTKTLQWLSKQKIEPNFLPALPAPVAGAAKSEISTIYQEPFNIREGKKNIAPGQFTPGDSGIISRPPPVPGTPAMRPGQAALPYTTPEAAPIIPPIVDRSGIVKNAPPPTPGVQVMRPGQFQLPAPLKVPPVSQDTPYKPYRPPRRKGSPKVIEGKIVP